MRAGTELTLRYKFPKREKILNKPTHQQGRHLCCPQCTSLFCSGFSSFDKALGLTFATKLDSSPTSVPLLIGQHIPTPGRFNDLKKWWNYQCPQALTKESLCFLNSKISEHRGLFQKLFPRWKGSTKAPPGWALPLANSKLWSSIRCLDNAFWKETQVL